MDNKTILLIAVQKHLAENPGDFAEIVDAATEGVKLFAEKQSDKSTKLAYRLADIISNTPNWESKCFDKKDVLDHIEPWFYNTPWFKELKDNVDKA